MHSVEEGNYNFKHLRPQELSLGSQVVNYVALKSCFKSNYIKNTQSDFVNYRRTSGVI